MVATTGRRLGWVLADDIWHAPCTRCGRIWALRLWMVRNSATSRVVFTHISKQVKRKDSLTFYHWSCDGFSIIPWEYLMHNLSRRGRSGLPIHFECRLTFCCTGLLDRDHSLPQQGQLLNAQGTTKAGWLISAPLITGLYLAPLYD